MKNKRRHKLLVVILILSGASLATLLVLYALRQNINLFYTPTQMFKGEVPKQQQLRIGGLVVKGTVHYSQDGKQVSFQLTDKQHDVMVKFSGLLPDLFREGQGIVAQGQLNQQGEFIAAQVLAKHDENYQPPEVNKALKEAIK